MSASTGGGRGELGASGGSECCLGLRWNRGGRSRI